jgi:hypothetical protein
MKLLPGAKVIRTYKVAQGEAGSLIQPGAAGAAAPLRKYM